MSTGENGSSHGRAPLRTAIVLLLFAVAAQAIRADEIDVSGEWQMTTSCGPGLSAVRSVSMAEDTGTGAVAVTATNCGTLFFESAIHVLAGCTASWAAQVSGGTFAAPPGGYVLDDVQFETPFPSSFLGCSSPPCARYTAEISFNGPITVDAGAATQISAAVTFGHVEVFDTDDIRTFNNGGPPGCTATFLRNIVPAGSGVTVTPLQDSTLTFDTVVTPGVVQLTPLTSPAAVVPANFQLLDLPIYYDVETTAVFAGTAALCLPYADADDNGFVDNTTPPIPEGNLLLLHEEDGVFVDRTAGIDTNLNRICAEVSSFSQFVQGASTGPSVCGDGSLQLGEQCDDGNTIGGDCCSAICQREAAGSSCPSDGNACTDDVCDANGACGIPAAADCDDNDPCTQDACNPVGGCENIAAPTDPCRPAGLSMLMLKRDASDASKDKLLWKWMRGESTTLAELQDPTDTAAYALCIYSGTNTLLAGMTVPPGSANWSPLGTKGFKYLDANGSAGGVKKMVLTAHACAWCRAGRPSRRASAP